MSPEARLLLWIASWIVAIDDRGAPVLSAAHARIVSWALATLREGALRAIERMETVAPAPPPVVVPPSAPPAPAVEVAPPAPPPPPPEPPLGPPPADPSLLKWISKALSVNCLGTWVVGRPPFVIDVVIATPQKTTRRLTRDEWDALAARGVQLLPHDAMMRWTSGGEA